MSRKYFGTDGIRGEVGGTVINFEFVRKLGYAVGTHLSEIVNPEEIKVVIGRDPRASGKMLEEAIVEGLAANKIQIYKLGIVPTPAVSLAVKNLKASLGIVVTASHNLANDNGIKFFSSEGMKISDHDEESIEDLIDDFTEPPSKPENIVFEEYDITKTYIDLMASVLPENALKGWKIVVDTAHGATVHTTPETLKKLGAEIIHVGDKPDGYNINDGVGSECTNVISDLVIKENANIGIAHDGDGDRVSISDECGSILEGDEVLGILGIQALREDKLNKKTLVININSNLSLDKVMQGVGGKTIRVPVGDRYISRSFVDSGYNLGGEPSGHIIVGDHSTCGDGLLAALKLIDAILKNAKPLSELRKQVPLFPCIRKSLKVKEKIPLEELPGLQLDVKELENNLPGKSRILIRYSGTEPKIRLIVEAENMAAVEKTYCDLTDVIGKHLTVIEG